MKEKFRKIIQSIEAKYDQLAKTKPFILKSFPANLPRKGIYLFSESKIFLYVGRSSNISNRLRYHVGYGHNQATFAFLLAREATGKQKPTYKKEGSRAELLKEPQFKKAFDDARKRIGNMKVRIIEELDPTQQALLEIYTAYVAKTKYNSFENS